MILRQLREDWDSLDESFQIGIIVLFVIGLMAIGLMVAFDRTPAALFGWQ